MRRTSLLVVALVGAAGVVLPAAPAAAVCMMPYYWVTGHCSPCSTGAAVYGTLDEASGGETLPDGTVFWTCVA